VAARRSVISNEQQHLPFTFPQWANYLLPAAAFVLVGGAIVVPILLTAGFSPATTDVGYAPQQPIPFSHAQHVGELKIDCRYCHSTVDKAAHAAIPSSQTCMNCHASIQTESAALAPLRESFSGGGAVAWKKVHDLPDYTYFNHAAHVNKGVGCVTCHGKVDEMVVVRQEKTLSMAWCLDCHRAPEQHLRPLDQVTNMRWDPKRDAGKSQAELGSQLKREYGIRGIDYMTSCSTCHR
jgi:menaquinone reductase, multiheme cytochrome c subunit